MSKRPRIKQADGSLLDLPLDAETLQGKGLDDLALKYDVTDAIDNFKADEFEPAINNLRDDIPTKVSQLINDSGYINQHQDISGKADKEDIPTKTSQLENDSNYATTSQLFSGDYNDLDNKPKIPTKTSELTNDSHFITNAVNNLTNYYLKSETYTKSEVKQLLSTISSLKLEVVTNLPTTNISSNTIYLKPLDSAKENNIYEEYIYINSKWETIGTTAVDLSNYALKADIPKKTSQLTNDSGFLTAHIDISGKQDTLVSGENIRTIDGRSLLGSGDITTYNLIYNSAGPTDTVKNVITQIRKYLNLNDGVTHYGYIGHIRYTGYKEYLNGYINLQVTNGGTHIAIRYNDILNQKHCSIEGDYAGIANMSINNFLDAYLVPNSPTKTSELENDSGFLSKIPSDVVTKNEQGAIKLEDDYGYVVISPSYIDMNYGGSSVYIGAEDGAMFGGVSATYIESESMLLYDTLEVDGDLYAEESTIYAGSIESTIYKDGDGNRIEFDNLISGIHLVSKSSSLALASTDMYGDDCIHELTFPNTAEGDYSSYQWDLPAKSGTIALTSDIPTLKTINGESIVGSGNIVIEGGGYVDLSGYLPKTSSGEAIINANSNVFRFGGSAGNGTLAVLANTGSSNYLRPGFTGTMDLGTNDEKWKDIYMVGKLTDGSPSAIKPSNSNEINFGSNANYIYFGYDNRVGSAGAVNTYNFGTHSGAAGAYSGRINCGDVYVDGGANQVARKSDIPSRVSNNAPTRSYIDYIGEENKNSQYQVAFRNNSQDNGICWSKFANMADSLMMPSACTYNGFFYVSSSTNSLSGADANPFYQYHPSGPDFRILTTAYSDQWLQQIATDFRTPYIYTRRRENGSWTSWTRLIDDNSIPFSYTFVLSNDSVPHYISTAGVKQLYFTMMSNDNDEDTLYLRTSNTNIVGMALKSNQLIDVIVDVAGGNYSMRNITSGTYSGGSYSNDGNIGLFVSSTSGSSTTIFAVRGYRN